MQRGGGSFASTRDPPPSPSQRRIASKRYAVQTGDVTTRGGGGARWQVRIAKGKTAVHAFAGKVRAGNALLEAGQTKASASR